MKTIFSVIRPLILALLVLASFIASTLAQEVSIPDPGLNAAIREALQIPEGPLTEQDLLRLINLDAGFRDVSSVEGLEAARNLTALELLNNRISSFTLPSGLTNLTFLDLSGNPFTNCSLASGRAGPQPRRDPRPAGAQLPARVAGSPQGENPMRCPTTAALRG